MFEIIYKDKESLNEYIENRKAYPNAVYDFTFENRFLVYHCEMTNELHYIALDMETGCGSEMCRRKKNSPIPPESFNSLIPSIFQSIKYTGNLIIAYCFFHVRQVRGKRNRLQSCRK